MRPRLSDWAEYDFLPPSKAIIAKPASPIRLASAFAICSMALGALAWAWFGKLDLYAVAPGRIQPAGRSKVIQPSDMGKVRRINTTDGAIVGLGDVLIELEGTDARAERDLLQRQLETLAAEVARRQAAIDTVRSGRIVTRPEIHSPKGVSREVAAREATVLFADLSELMANVATLDGKLRESIVQQEGLVESIAAQERTLSTVNKRVEIRRALEKDGWTSAAEVLDAQEVADREQVAWQTERGQLQHASAESLTLQRQITEARSHFVDDNAQALETAAQKLDTVSQDLIKASVKLDRTIIRAPMSGTVQQLAVTTVGQVVSSGQQLMTIVPAGETLEIVALVSNQDIGFVRPGQPAIVKVTSFPFTRYGTLKGQVKFVAQDSVTTQEAIAATDPDAKPVQAHDAAAAAVPRTQDLVFPVVVKLDDDSMPIEGHKTRMSPGMSVTVEIRTGKRRVLDYVLSPFTETTSEAMHER